MVLIEIKGRACFLGDNELLLALSEMMDNKLKSLNEKIGKIEADMNSGFDKIDKIEVDMNSGFDKIDKIEVDMNSGFDKIDKIEADMNSGFNRINIVLENEIRQDIKLIAENYLPAAKRYEKAVLETENMKADIELLKKVVTEHSEKLQKIS